MRRWLLATILLGSAACADDPAPFEFSDGALRYEATTTVGLPLLEGELRLRYPTDSTVAGTWSIRRLPNADPSIEVGPQVGAGTVAGFRDGHTLYLDLNPGWADDNVMLVGEAAAGALRGRWTWSAFTGPRASGRFTAEPD